MSTVIGTITLDNDLILDNEYEYSLINASVENTIGGGIVVQEFNKLEKGRNIVLRSTDSQGLQLKSTVDDFHFEEEQLPKISIIVPVYNEAKIIPNKIANMQQTKYPPEKLEVIFVDGGSEDETAEQIEKLSKTVSYTQKIVRQGTRKGFNSAVIEGLEVKG